MIKFDSYETEQQYYKVISKHGIIGASCQHNHIITMKDVVKLEKDDPWNDNNDTEIVSEEFFEFP